MAYNSMTHLVTYNSMTHLVPYNSMTHFKSYNFGTHLVTDNSMLSYPVTESCKWLNDLDMLAELIILAIPNLLTRLANEV